MFFFFLFHNFFCYEGKHQGIQQNLTYPTEEKQNTEEKGKGEKNRENKTTDKEMTHNLD